MAFMHVRVRERDTVDDLSNDFFQVHVELGDTHLHKLIRNTSFYLILFEALQYHNPSLNRDFFALSNDKELSYRSHQMCSSRQ